MTGILKHYSLLVRNHWIISWLQIGQCFCIYRINLRALIFPPVFILSTLHASCLSFPQVFLMWVLLLKVKLTQVVLSDYKSGCLSSMRRLTEKCCFLHLELILLRNPQIGCVLESNKLYVTCKTFWDMHGIQDQSAAQIFPWEVCF